MYYVIDSRRGCIVVATQNPDEAIAVRDAYAEQEHNSDTEVIIARAVKPPTKTSAPS